MEGEIITIETAQKLAEYDKLKKQYEKVLNDYCRLDAYNRTQQKKFINYLEDEYTKIQNDIEKEIDNNVKYFKIERRQIITEILQKYKSIIGDYK